MEDLYNYVPESYTDSELFDRVEIDLGGSQKPGVRLILEVIRSAVNDQDLEYFLGDTFTYHCYLVGLDSDFLLTAILKDQLIIEKRKSTYTPHKSEKVRADIIYKREVEKLSVKDIAEEYSISLKTVRKLLDLTYSPAIPFNGKQYEIIEDYKNGMSIKNLKNKYKISSSTIYRALENTKKINKVDNGG